MPSAHPATIHEIPVTRTARYALLGTPSPAATEVWFVCHGYGQLATRFIRRFEPLAAAGRLIVAPEGLSRYYVESGSGEHSRRSQVGATWMTSESRESEIADYVRYLDAVYAEIFRETDRQSVFVRALGFSQGTATVERWVTLGDSRLDEVIHWAGSLPTELASPSAARLAPGRPLILVAGDQDPFITPALLEQQMGALDQLGVGYRRLSYKGGHEIDGGVLLEIAGAGGSPE